MFTLSDDTSAQEIVDLTKVHMSVHMYVQHWVSQPDYYDDPIEDETTKSADVVILDEEDVIAKLVDEVANGKRDGVDLNVDDNEDVDDLNDVDNVKINEVGMNEGEVKGTNVDVNETNKSEVRLEAQMLI